MFITYEHEENYILAIPQWDQLSERNLPEFTGSIMETLADFPQVIINASTLTYFGEEANAFFEVVKTHVDEHKGIIVVVAENEHVASQLEEKGINCVPTEDEAVDFIFMEQIERDLYNDRDAEDEG